ncbi:hypothetical protein D3C83_324540 [compost metagenome]
MSLGSATIVAPFRFARAAAASQSSTATYGSHIVGASPCAFVTPPSFASPCASTW